MNMIEATKRLTVLAESYHAGTVERELDEDGMPGYQVSESEMDAVVTAAAILGMFVEALDADALT